MTRTTAWRWSAALLVLVLALPLRAAPSPGEKTALSQVPASAPLVIYLHGVERTKDRVVALMKTALPDQAPVVEQKLNEWFKDGVEGRKLQGLPKDGAVLLAFLEMPKNLENPPKAALIVAVTDYAKFRDGLLDDDQRKGLKRATEGYEVTPLAGNEQLYFVDKKGYAVVTPDKDTAVAFTKPQPGLDGKISKDQSAKLLGSDLGIYLSMDVFNKQYAEQIKAVREFANTQLLQSAEQSGQLDKATLKLLKTMIESTFQAVEDSQGFLATIDVRPTGLAVHAQTEIRPNTPTSTALKDAKTEAFADLERLPSGQFYYTAVKPNPTLIKAVGPTLYGVTGDPKDEENKAITQAFDQIVKAGPGESVSCVAMPLASLQVLKFEQPAKAVDAYVQLARAMKPGVAYQSVVLKTKPTVKPNDQKYRGFELSRVEADFDLDKTIERAFQMEPPEEFKKSMAALYKKMIGEKLSYWVGTDGKSVYQVVAPDWKSAQKLLDQYFNGKGGVGDDAAFRAVRKELPADASLYGLMDPVLYGGFLSEAFKIGFEGAAGGALKLPANFPAMPAKHQPSYFGGSVRLSPERGSVDVFFSAKGINESYKAFAKPFLNFF